MKILTTAQQKVICVILLMLIIGCAVKALRGGTKKEVATPAQIKE